MQCRDCKYKEVDYLTAYDGRQIVQFSYCVKNIVAPKMVDPDVERDCVQFQQAEKEVAEDATIG